MDERTKKFVLSSWAKGFLEIIFPAISEERFSVLYSETKGSRPNNPVNAVVGSLILKELLRLTDDELLASILCDMRFQYALHTTSFKEQPFSDRTFSRFRERLYLYTLETGIDLLQEEMESMAEAFLDYLNIEPSMKRMDSVMAASNCKTMTRLEILYICTTNMIKVICQADKKHKGYAGNIVETFDDQSAIITGYDYDINGHSDSQFCKETINKLGHQDEATTLLVDGAYASTDNHEQATQNNIELVATALIGKTPNPVQGDFMQPYITLFSSETSLGWK
ncbi:transposase [Acetobacterium tundrae]|uniref:transposase n=1 Tax=Acetobacterium tundrae TaxID=132932 RepID=UPI001FAB0E07|nr:transposase [Acetobacterium tundrae]